VDAVATCEHRGCCDDSPSRHAAKRFTVPEQPVSSIAPAEQSWSCYVYEVEFRAYDLSNVSYR